MIEILNDNYIIYSLIIMALSVGLLISGKPFGLFKYKIQKIDVFNIVNMAFVSIFCFLMIKIFIKRLYKINIMNMSVLFLLTSGLIVFINPVLQGCTSTRLTVRPIVAPQTDGVVKDTESYTTEPYYISQEAQSFLLSNGITLGGLGGGNLIMDIRGEVTNIRSLCERRATSFTTVQMPKDMERILKKYKTGDEYDDYYGYVMANLQRVVLCPEMYFYNKSPMGFITYGLTILDMSGNDVIYPAENTVYINTLYKYNVQGRDSIIRLISDVIHETSHILLHKLVADGKLPYYYLSDMYSERHSYIRQVNFLKAAVQDSEFSVDRTLLNWHIAWREKRIEDYNSSLGLPHGDRTLFPK